MRIGHGAIVGANSVVTHDVPPMTVVGDNPARFIKKIETKKGGINPSKTFPARSGRVTAPSPEAETTASGLGLLRMKRMHKKIRRCAHTLNYIMRNASPAHFCAASQNASHARCRFN